MHNNSLRALLVVPALLLIVLFALMSCGKGSAYVLKPQHWGDVEFMVELRPGAPRVGMNEFLVVATDKSGKPGYEYVISIKVENATHWTQTIQDGRTGVYRRALELTHPETDVLLVKVEARSSHQIILRYPLTDRLQVD
jgi:hypothetical protein